MAFDVTHTWIYLTAEFAIALALFLYVCFFLVHAMQRVTDPRERAAWLLLFILLHVVTATVYLFTKHRRFRQIGKGDLIKGSGVSWANMFSLSEVEQKTKER